ncbi:hypothetical protein RIF29_24345 [Crotalaria pallida]|uniref:Acyltransferase n=1 Tax=Crotalaria pallida TaxID=3830 RepID=A0AAN9I029_CROPI
MAASSCLDVGRTSTLLSSQSLQHENGASSVVVDTDNTHQSNGPVFISIAIVEEGDKLIFLGNQVNLPCNVLSWTELVEEAVKIEHSLSPNKPFYLVGDSLGGCLAFAVDARTLLWKLKLLKSAASYANSRVHAVKAEVLVLASCKDKILPSENEAQRLARSLENCKVRNFKDNGHTFLLEDGIDLLTIIKGTCMYRRSRRLDFVRDFIPPSMTEFRYARDQVYGLFRYVIGSVMFLTLEDGKIVKEGHYASLISLSASVDEGNGEFFLVFRVFCDGLGEVLGAIPVSATNIFKFLSTKSYVLLYPGGVPEALHFKDEEYKMIWLDQPEFVRMAAQFGGTIVPFGPVGEDDIGEEANKNKRHGEYAEGQRSNQPTLPSD